MLSYHPITPPLQADAYGDALQGPLAGAGLSGMISVEWTELKPPTLSPAYKAAYIKAILAVVCRGATVTVTTHLDDPSWTGSRAGPCCDRDRTGCGSTSPFHTGRYLLEHDSGSSEPGLAGVRGLLEAATNGTASASTTVAAAATNGTVAASSTMADPAHHSGASGRKPYKPLPGRLVTNTLILGCSDRQRLNAALQQIKRYPNKVFSPRQVR